MRALDVGERFFRGSRRIRPQVSDERRDKRLRCCRGDALEGSRRIRPQVAGEGTTPSRNLKQPAGSAAGRRKERSPRSGRAWQRWRIRTRSFSCDLRPDPAAASENADRSGSGYGSSPATCGLILRLPLNNPSLTTPRRVVPEFLPQDLARADPYPSPVDARTASVIPPRSGASAGGASPSGGSPARLSSATTPPSTSMS